MSSSTWTPRAVGSEAADRQLSLWRAVEAQHLIATRALVDSLAEQELLETLLEQSKPPIPLAATGLDYLLYTPFRYPPALHGSRFRGRTDPGVWYGAEAVRTCCAELGYWRWRFIMDSRGLQRLDGVPHTIFHALPSGQSIDLRAAPFARDRDLWRDANSYAATQALAHSARLAAVWMIRYESVRDPEHGGCGAVLDCRAFRRSGGVRTRQSWFLTVDRQRASWIRARARQAERYEFVFGAG
jgi:hypothetical protein